MVRDPRFHGRRHAQRSVKLAEVVEPEVQRNRRAVVFEFLAEPIRELGEVPYLHPHREVLALHMRSADFGGVTHCVAGRGRASRGRIKTASGCGEPPQFQDGHLRRMAAHARSSRCHRGSG